VEDDVKPIGLTCASLSLAASVGCGSGPSEPYAASASFSIECPHRCEGLGTAADEGIGTAADEGIGNTAADEGIGTAPDEGIGTAETEGLGTAPGPASGASSGAKPAAESKANRAEVILLADDATLRAYLNINGLDGFPFAGPAIIGTGWYVPERVRFADIDGDGKDEVVLIADDGTLRAYPNVNGMHGFPFAGPIVIGTAGTCPSACALPNRRRRQRRRHPDCRRRHSACLPQRQWPGRLPLRRAHRHRHRLVRTERVRFADIDGDGRDEVILIADDDTLRAYPNVNGLDGFPFAGPIVIGSGWYVPSACALPTSTATGRTKSC
jgi:hypothetical protein